MWTNITAGLRPGWARARPLPSLTLRRPPGRRRPPLEIRDEGVVVWFANVLYQAKGCLPVA
eukprot:2971301-Lingulodinium_polyedra.AAC.1